MGINGFRCYCWIVVNLVGISIKVVGESVNFI